MARVKVHLQSWLHPQMPAFLDWIEQRAMSGAEVLCRLLVALLADRPRLSQFCEVENKVGVAIITMDSLSSPPLRALSLLLSLFTSGCLSLKCRSLALLCLSRGLPANVFDGWLAPHLDKVFETLAEQVASSDNHHLLLLFERLLAPSTAQFGEGLSVEERRVAQPLFEGGNFPPVYPSLAPLVSSRLASLLSVPKVGTLLHTQLLALVSKALAVASDSSRAALSEALRKVDPGQSIVSQCLFRRSLRVLGTRAISAAVTQTLTHIDARRRDVSTEHLCSQMETLSSELSPQNIPDLVAEGLALFGDKENRSRTLSLYLETGIVDNRDLLIEVLFVHILLRDLREASQIPKEETVQQLIAYLISTLTLPSLPLSLASLKCLRCLFRSSEPLNKSEEEKEGESPAKRRKVNQPADTLLDLCDELVSTPNTFDSAHSKGYLISRIGEEAEKLITQKSLLGSSVSRSLRLTAVSVLFSQTTTTFTPLWSPAISALTSLHKRGTEDYIIGMIWSHLSATLSARLRTQRERSQAFIVPSVKRKMQSKVDASYITAAIDFRPAADSQELQLLSAWSSSAHLNDCTDLAEREMSQMVSLALFAPRLKAGQAFSNLCTVLASLIGALSLGQCLAPHKSLQMRSVTQVLAESVRQLGSCVCNGQSVYAVGPGLSVSRELLSVLESSLSNREKGEMMTSLLACLSALKPLDTDKVPIHVRTVLEEAAVLSVNNLLSIPHPPLQEIIISAFHGLKLPEDAVQLPTLSRFRLLTNELVEKLKGLSLAGKRFKSKLQELGDLESTLHPSEKELGLDSLVHLCFSHLALKGSQRKGADRSLIVSVLSSMDRSQVSLFVSLMLSRLFSHPEASRSEILAALRQTIATEATLAQVFWDIAPNGETTLRLQKGGMTLLFDISVHPELMQGMYTDGTVPSGAEMHRVRDILKRLSGFLSLLTSLLMQFRQKILWLVPFVSSLLAAALKAVHHERFVGNELTDLKRHLIRDLLKLIFTVFDIFPSVSHVKTLEDVYPCLHTQLAKAIRAPAAFTSSAPIRFVTAAARRGHTLFVLAQKPQLVAMTLSALTQETVLAALSQGKPVALVDEALGLMKSLWRAMNGNKAEKRRQTPKRTKKSKGRRDDDSDSSGAEERHENDHMEPSAEEAVARNLIESHISLLLRALRELVTARKGEGETMVKASIISQEISLLIDFAELPQLQQPEAKEDREMARDLLVLLISAVPQATHKDQQKLSSRIEKLGSACLPLVPSLREVVNGEDRSLFRAQGTDDVLSLSVRRCVSLLTVVSSGTCREVLAELIVSLTLTQHSKLSPLSHLTALRSAEHPSKFKKEPLQVWHPDNYDWQLRKAESKFAGWDMFFAHIIYALCCRSATDFSAMSGDPELQVSVIGWLVQFGFVDGVSAGQALWPSEYLEPLATMVLFLSTDPSLDLGVATVVDKFWSVLFRRIGKVAQLRKFVLDQQVDPTRVTDKEHWQAEMLWAASMSRSIPDSIVSFATSSLT